MDRPIDPTSIKKILDDCVEIFSKKDPFIFSYTYSLTGEVRMAEVARAKYTLEKLYSRYPRRVMGYIKSLGKPISERIMTILYFRLLPRCSTKDIPRKRSFLERVMNLPSEPAPYVKYDYECPHCGHINIRQYPWGFSTWMAYNKEIFCRECGESYGQELDFTSVYILVLLGFLFWFIINNF